MTWCFVAFFGDWGVSAVIAHLQEIHFLHPQFDLDPGTVLY